MRKIINVKPLENYELEITFDDNVIKVKDMKPYLSRGVFQALRDKRILEIKGRIGKLPTKISIISVLFFIPIILLVILSPVLIEFLGGV